MIMINVGNFALRPHLVLFQSMPEFEGKKFQNVAKEGLEFGDEGEGAKEQLEEYTETYKPLTDWLKDDALREHIDKAVVSNRLTDSPCALVASQYGWWVCVCVGGWVSVWVGGWVGGLGRLYLLLVWEWDGSYIHIIMYGPSKFDAKMFVCMTIFVALIDTIIALCCY